MKLNTSCFLRFTSCEQRDGKGECGTIEILQQGKNTMTEQLLKGLGDALLSVLHTLQTQMDEAGRAISKCLSIWTSLAKDSFFVIKTRIQQDAAVAQTSPNCVITASRASRTVYS